MASLILPVNFRPRKNEKSRRKTLENVLAHFNLQERISDQIDQLEGFENRFITGSKI